MRPSLSKEKTKVSIVVPVYADWTSLRQNIKSLKKYYANNPLFKIYYVNDCGPQANYIERKITKSIANTNNFYYSRNEVNLGFVKNCNNAVFNLVIDKKSDILLLNSDTVVTQDSLEEMLNALYSEDDICAVNPRSNNATVWSVPTDASLAGKPHKSYKLWEILRKQLPTTYISPTAHGFCMLIRRDVIDDIGLFDEIYGRGYGEENDFTMRARKTGWKCAVANHAFVFHHGSRSFGHEKRNDLSDKNTKILLNRYPEYNRLIAQYVSDHPEPKKLNRPSVLYRLFQVSVKAVEYGHANGYVSMLRKAAYVISHRYFPRKTFQEESHIQIWSHEITKSGAPLVLFDILKQWRDDKNYPENILFNFPYGSRVDSALLNELNDDGFNFKPVRAIEISFNKGDIVILNSTAQPGWVYEKIINELNAGVIHKLYFCIHEDDEHTTDATKAYKLALQNLLEDDRITIYVPSTSSAKKWGRYFEINKNIFSMPGHIGTHSKMFVEKSPIDFEEIKFIIAGSREPRKGILNVLHALQTVEIYHIQKSPSLYRNFSLTIVGDDHNYDFHNRFIRNEASYFGDRVELLGNTDHQRIYELLHMTNFTITYSVGDSLSMVTFEGMAFGHPIIRSESSGQKEQLIIGQNGWLAHTTNWGELVEALEQVLNKDKTPNEILSHMSRQSIKIAKDNNESTYRILEDIRKDLA